jgi:ferredoxin-type protein NapG
MSKPKVSRRAFVGKIAQGTALATTGGLMWTYLLHQQARAAPHAIRPPGAREAGDFNARCIKCGQCVQACPYDTLSLASVGEAIPIGTPYFTPREIPCYMCPDIPCRRACPTGALDPDLEDINEARMGLAVIDVEHCLSWQGLRCEVCHRECPVKDQAITVELQPRRVSKHAMFVPMVHSAHCTGCGICENACPTEEAAIRVVPPDLVQGKLGKHYRLQPKPSAPRDQTPPAPPTPTRSNTAATSALDYLNEGASR